MTKAGKATPSIFAAARGSPSHLPKSTKPGRIAENIDVFDLELSAEEMTSIDSLDTGRRGGPEPEAITIEAFGHEIPES